MGSRGSSSNSKKADVSAPAIKGYDRFSKEVLIGTSAAPRAVMYFYEAEGASRGSRDHIVVYKDEKGNNKRYYAETSGDAYDKALKDYFKAYPEQDTTRSAQNIIGVAETYISPELKK